MISILVVLWDQGARRALPATNYTSRTDLKGSGPGGIRPAWDHRVPSGSGGFTSRALVRYNPTAVYKHSSRIYMQGLHVDPGA